MSDEVLEFFASQGRLFKEAAELERVDDSDLTPDEPYKSKYIARKIYRGILDRVVERVAEVENNSGASSTTYDVDAIESRLLACRATTLLYLGVNAYETEEVSDGERHLRACLDLLSKDDWSIDPRFITIVIHAYNHVGIVWNLLKDHNKSLEYFARAKDMHLAYMETSSQLRPPDNLLRCFNDDCAVELTLDGDNTDDATAALGEMREGVPQKMTKEFQSLHTHTLYFLAQCYERLGEKEKSAACCHETLSRQLELEDFEPCDWSRNAAILSQYYVGVGEMKRARHCLAAAAVMFGGKEFKAEVDEEEEERDKTCAEMQRCWSAYALSLLRYSKEAAAKHGAGDRDPDVSDELLQRITVNALEDVASSRLSFVIVRRQNNNDDGSIKGAGGSGVGECIIGLGVGIGGLDAEKVADQESKVAADVVETFEEARALFLFGTNCLDDAKAFYTKDSRCSDYISILQSASQFYKFLADFEPDIGRQCKMHKRRIDSLTEILKELNPTYYLMIMRQLRFELGEAYAAMMDLKYVALEELAVSTGGKKPPPPKPQVVAKINSLTKSAIDHFQDFIQSFHRTTPSVDGGTISQIPDTFEEMNVRPVLLCYFHIARLYTKYVEADPRKRVVNMEVAKGFYQKLVDYVESHMDVEDLVKNEYEVSRELIPMMDIKAKSIKAAIIS